MVGDTVKQHDLLHGQGAEVGGGRGGGSIGMLQCSTLMRLRDIYHVTMEHFLI